MSRVFSDNSANYLSGSATAPSVPANATFFGWVKDAGIATLNDRCPFAIRTSSGRRWASAKSTEFTNYVDGFGYAASSSTFASNVWRSLALRITDQGSGNFLWELFVDGTMESSRTIASAPLLETAASIVVGATTSNSLPYNGKVAHHAAWLRALSNAEITNLAGGTNPSDLSSTGQFFYYPMDGSALDNAWSGTPGSTLTVNGMVAVDAADNPPVSAPSASVAISTADNVTSEGQTKTFTLAGNSAAPTAARINGTSVGTLTLVSGGTYSYTAPLIADDATATLEVDVDSSTLSTTIAYTNSYQYVLTNHGTPDANSIMYGNQFATTGPVELKVVSDFDPAVLTVDWQAMSDNQEWLTDINSANSVTWVSDGFSTATIGYYVPDTGDSGTFDCTVGTAFVEFGTPTIGSNVASFPFTFPGTDVTGFEYSLDGGAWTATTSPVQLSTLSGDTPYTLEVRPVNDSGAGVPTSYDFTTASSVDATPAPFSFTPQTNVARSITVTSNTITVTDVDAGVDIPVTIAGDTGSEYSVSTDGGSTWGGWTSAATNVRLNYRIRVRHTTSNEYSSGGYDGVRETTLTVGGVSATFTSTTLADTVPPVISLTGGNVSIVEGSAWVEPGYEAIDNADGDISVGGVSIAGSVDTGTPGEYILTYTATDASGNSASTTRRVTVTELVPDDTVEPVITLSGGNRTLTEGDTWVDPGYSATDNVDGDLTAQVTVTGTVNTATPGSYTLTYSVTDAAGNTGTATRTVTVLPAVDYPFDVNAPARRTIVGTRYGAFQSSEEVKWMQSGEVLDYDFDLTDWLALEGDQIAEGTHEASELADSLEVVASGTVTGTSRIKVWLRADQVKDSESSLVQMKVTTTSYRTAVFQFRVLVINRMQ